jgi:hypothetical protein
VGRRYVIRRKACTNLYLGEIYRNDFLEATTKNQYTLQRECMQPIFFIAGKDVFSVHVYSSVRRSGVIAGVLLQFTVPSAA